MRVNSNRLTESSWQSNLWLITKIQLQAW